MPMSKIVTMTQTVGGYINGQTYRVRSKNAELMAKASQATVSSNRGAKSGIANDKEGK